MPTRTPIDHLADNIKAIREARGLSQQQIAKSAAIPRATWTNLESGAANPTLAVLVKVASALEVRLDELLAPPRQAARSSRDPQAVARAAAEPRSRADDAAAERAHGRRAAHARHARVSRV